MTRTESLPDISFQNEGSIYLLRSRTDAGRDWLLENLPDDALTFGDAIVVEHRFIPDIASGIRADGLTAGSA